MSQSLGVFKKLDVRSQWPHEEYDFTPWLARKENIAALGEVIGIELEVVGIEQAVGPYFVDILAKDLLGGQHVIIENQLAKINHDHLGKALTYASFYDASAIIWIATEFTEQHQRAIEWLNDNIIENGPGLYAVLIELWQIDDSRPAIRFNVISRPAVIKSAAAQGELSSARLRQLDFWVGVVNELRERKVAFQPRGPKAQSQYEVSLGKTGIFIANRVNVFTNKISVRLYVCYAYQPTAYVQLMQYKDEIEKTMGEPLSWDPNDQKLDKAVVLEKSFDLSDESKWLEAISWMGEKIDKIYRVFQPYVKNLGSCPDKD